MSEELLIKKLKSIGFRIMINNCNTVMGKRILFFYNIKEGLVMNCVIDEPSRALKEVYAREVSNV